MNKSAFFIVQLIFLSVCTTSFSQTNENYKIVPPSPEATAFAKYGELPVDMHYGRPNITIPLYEINSKELSFPISISYNTAGIKVDEMASSIGLGWTLNAGGVISAKIKCRSDIDQNGKGFMLNGSETIRNMSNRIARLTVESKEYDTESDIYFYNFNKYSGKFYFGGGGPSDIIFSPEFQPLKITFKSNNGKNFEVIDERGCVYEFGLKEECSYYTDPGSQERHISAWYLTKIFSPNRTDSICFNYSANIYYISNYSWTSVNQLESTDLVLPHPLVSKWREHSYNTRYESWALESITFSNGKVIFEKYGNREDFCNKGVARYNSIKIYDVRDSLLKNINFNYSYFISNSAAVNGEEYLNKRLRLDSIDVKDGTGSKIYPYIFKYNETPLPSLKSRQRDYWGYYNGAEQNDGPGGGALFVKSEYLPHLEYGERKASALHMLAGSLKEIKYPTGGFTSLDLEPNQVSMLVNGRDEYSFFGQSPIICDDYNTTFQIKGASTIKVDITFPEIPDNIFDANKSDIELIKMTGFEADGEPELTSIINGITGRAYYHSSTSPFFIANPISKIATISPGAVLHIYTKAMCINGTGYRPSIKISYRNSEYSESKPTLVGGLRVKRIISKSDGASNSLVKTYNYAGEKYLLGEGKQIFEYIAPYYYAKQDFGMSKPSTGVVTQLLRSQRDIRDDGSSSNYICYTNVDEVLEDNGIPQGKIKTEYTFQPNSSSLSSSLFIPVQDNSIYRGKPFRITYYDKDSMVLKHVYNYYNVINVGTSNNAYCSAKGFNIRGAYHNIISSDAVINSLFSYDFYPVYSRRVVLDSTITVERLKKSILKTKKEFKYMDSFPYLINSEITFNSRGNRIETRTFYPSDINASPYISMVAKNLLNYPIEQITRIDGKLAHAKLTTYKIISGLFLKDQLRSLKNQNSTGAFTPYNGTSFDKNYSEIPDADFIEYNSNGNINKMKEKNGLYLYYIWAYRDQYPVAKIETSNSNLDISSVQNNINTLAFSYSSNWVDVKRDRDILNSYLVNLMRDNSNLVTSYTYRPLVGMTSQTTPNGNSTYFDYDLLGRLKDIRDRKGNIISHYGYGYCNYYNKSQIFKNTLRTGIFSKNNCLVGNTGSEVTYTVLAGKYTSTISQADADSQAQDEINIKGQDYANANGTCYYLTPSSSLANFGKGGGTQAIQISSNTTWGTSTSSSWITVTPTSTGGGSPLNITCSANSGGSRTGTVTLQATPAYGGITKVIAVNQEANSFLIAQDIFHFNGVERSFDINVSSSSSWSIVSREGSFITADKINEQTLRVTLDRNIGTLRSGSITISNGSQIVAIKIYQAAWAN